MTLDAFYQTMDRYFTRGERDALERFLLDCAQAQDVPLRLAAYNELGAFFRGAGRYARSLAAFEEAEALAAEYLGVQSAQYATILNNMAGTYRLAGDPDGAAALFDRAAEIYRAAGADGSDAYISLLNNLALALRESGQYGRALDCLEQALARITRLPGRQQETAITCNNLAALCWARKDKAQAMEWAERAIQAFARCREEENVHYAAGLNSLAGLLAENGELQRALTLYRESLRYTLRFFGRNPEYAITLQNMAWVYERLNDRPRAEAALAEAAQIYAALLGGAHEHTRGAAQKLRQLREGRDA